MEEVDPERLERIVQRAAAKGANADLVRKKVGRMKIRIPEDTDLGIEAIQLAPGVPSPNVPAVIVSPQIPPLNTIDHKKFRAILTQQEFDIFMDQWNQIWVAHIEEYDKPEDKIDVGQICLEEAIKFRLLLAQKHDPRLDNSQPYNQAVNRQQIARQNLAARRVDRVGTKANAGSKTLNIAVLAGTVDAKGLEARAKLAAKQEAEDLKYLQGTKKIEAPELEPIEVKAEVQENAAAAATPPSN